MKIFGESLMISRLLRGSNKLIPDERSTYLIKSRGYMNMITEVEKQMIVGYQL